MRTTLFTVILFGSGILAYVLLLLGAVVTKPHIFATVVCVLIYALVALMVLGSAGADLRSALSGPRWSNARRLRWAVVWICAVYVAIAFQETLVDLLKRSHLDVTEGQLAFVLFYWPLAKISLDFVGYSLALGFLAFAALYCFGFCWCACCCGRSGMRRRAKRKADGQEPFIDLIENRSISWLANTLMFVITFALPSYVALAGTAMVGPDRVLPLVPGAPSALVPLCKGAALAALQRPAEAALGNPALAWLAVHSWWRSSLAPIHELCFANGDAGLAPLTVASTGADVRAAEALWLAVRDANKLAVPNQEVVAQITNFSGSCGPNATAPTLLDDEGAPTAHLRAVSGADGLVSFAVRLAAGGCGEGWLRLRAWHAPFEIDRIDANGTAREQYDMEELYSTLSQTLWVWLSMFPPPTARTYGVRRFAPRGYGVMSRLQ